MTQSALAEAVGCKQSAISMFEAGQIEKLSRETVKKIAALLEVPWPKGETPAVRTEPPAPRGYCPNAFCPSNLPYTVNGDLLFWPRRQPDTAGARCAFCGELLETRCPTCDAPFGEGACCTRCGTARIANPLPPESDPEAWALQRRRTLAQLYHLIEQRVDDEKVSDCD
ncbi:MAG: helix-turn-helix transcriptional regulator [Kiritimatiellae bacterium]|nr:helix-turn-helix transcriptional regulator [Kiritimatiellia bacterium]